MKYLKTTLLILVIFTSCKENKPVNLTNAKALNPIAKIKKTLLIGEVYNRPQSDTLLLLKSTEDARQDKGVFMIPITNGKFEYELESNEKLKYNLIFKEEHDNGGWSTIGFFNDTDTVKFKLHSKENTLNNLIEGGELNDYNNVYKAQIFNPLVTNQKKINKDYEIFEYQEMNSKAFNSLLNRLDKANDLERVGIYKSLDELKLKNLHRSDLGKELDIKHNIIYKKYQDERQAFITDNLSIVTYSMVISDLMSLSYKENLEEQEIFNAFKKHKRKFPNHSYSKLGANLIHALKNLNLGGQYVNFNARDIKGKEIEFSSVLKENKIVLLDLWATWCGPCINKTRLAKPVYEKFKNKGFTILGVAGERKNLNNFKKFMEKENWPWQQLTELDDENKIWEKYNVKNSGGGMFLIASTGELLAVNPSAQELEIILEQKL